MGKQVKGGRQGSKYSEDIRERALALVASGHTRAYAAERVGASESAVRSWVAASMKDDPEELAKLREKKKLAFAARAWADMEASERLIRRRIKAANAQLDALEAIICEASREELSEEERRALLRKLAAVKIDDIGKLATVMGVLYDKSELAAGGVTERVDVQVPRFEDV